MADTKEKMSKKKIAVIISAAVAAVAIIAIIIVYIGKVNFYKTHFLPNSIINSMDCSGLDAETVAGMLDEKAKEYTLSVIGRAEDKSAVEIGRVKASDINLELTDALGAANDVLNQQNPYTWCFLSKEEQRSYNIAQGVTFDETLLKKQVEAFEACQKEKMTAPSDAYISEYLDEIGGCEIIPEVMGTQLDVKKAVASINAAVYGCAESVDLVEQGCYESPEILATDDKLVADLEKINKWLATEITYDWNTFEVIVDKDIIKDWILRNDEIKIDEEAVAAFVSEQAAKYDTYGKSRKFVTTLGVELTLPSGKFGWRTDREQEAKELLGLIEEGKVTKREPVYSHTAPKQGMSDIGSSYVEADLSNQHLYLYYKGTMVFETDFVSGSMSSTPDCVTPQGVFGITYKTTNAVLRGNGYETPVTYWMPFHGNYGMHDATWRTEFGGDIFMTNGSHGCLNLPLDSAATIYSYMYEGYPVICYYY